MVFPTIQSTLGLHYRYYRGVHLPFQILQLVSFVQKIAFFLILARRLALLQLLEWEMNTSI